MTHIAVRPHRNGYKIHAMRESEGAIEQINRLRPGSMVLWGRTLCSTPKRPIGAGGLRVSGLDTSKPVRTYDAFEDLVNKELNAVVSGKVNTPEVNRIEQMFCPKCVRKVGSMGLLQARP